MADDRLETREEFTANTKYHLSMDHKERYEGMSCCFFLKLQKEARFLTFTRQRKGNALLISMDTDLSFLAISNLVRKITV